jgi:inhibitor of KinA sporulation pathway (predicted exonuclease)
MMILVVDLEATCSDDGRIARDGMETIEVGACWATREGHVGDSFQSFVRPLQYPVLTSFCTGITHIQQSDVDRAPSWGEVAEALADFAARYREAGQCWGSRGDYDAHQIEHDSVRHGVANPLEHLAHQNLKACFAKRRKIKQVGMATALQIVGLQLGGDASSSACGCTDIARLLPWSLCES